MSILLIILIVPLSLIPAQAATPTDVQTFGMSTFSSPNNDFMFIGESSGGGIQTFAVSPNSNWTYRLLDASNQVLLSGDLPSDGIIVLPPTATNVRFVLLYPKSSTSYGAGDFTFSIDFTSNGIPVSHSGVYAYVNSAYQFVSGRISNHMGGYRVGTQISSSANWTFNYFLIGVNPSAGAQQRIQINKIDMGVAISEETGLLGGINQGIQNLYAAITGQSSSFSNMTNILDRIYSRQQDVSIYITTGLNNILEGILALGTGIQVVYTSIQNMQSALQSAIASQTAALQGAIDSQTEALQGSISDQTISINARLSLLSLEIQQYLTALGDRIEAIFNSDEYNEHAEKLKDDMDSLNDFTDQAKKDAEAYEQTAQAALSDVQQIIINVQPVFNSTFGIMPGWLMTILVISLVMVVTRKILGR